ncbi:MAG: hypothetical protein QXK37_00415 [Candidatus Woesearchaeota archaeon]
MPFTKSFPKTSDKSFYPRWEEVTLSEHEEKLVEEQSRRENLELMEECLEDAKHILHHAKLKEQQSDLVGIAIALFEKRASHTIFKKEEKAKEKFNSAKNEQAKETSKS